MEMPACFELLPEWLVANTGCDSGTRAGFCKSSIPQTGAVMKKLAVVACPQCGKEVAWSGENRYRPFCSERCKLIDLGQWASESYRIPQEEGGADQEADRQA
jgi:endogenous inhibitor of DNA gyrase (YacG/DUF329 family)